MPRARILPYLVLVGLAAGPHAVASPPRPQAKTIPITTASEEARSAYLEGRQLAQDFRVARAKVRYEAALARDRNLALAWLGLYGVAWSDQERLPLLERAVALAGRASPGERLLIEAEEAGFIRQDFGRKRQLLTELVRRHPDDAQSHFQLGSHEYFEQHEHRRAAASLERAVAIAPTFAAARNRLGYVYRSLGRYPDAEEQFKKYIELIPGDPNPYDSYAELLLKMGRFEESIANYEKALAIEPKFRTAYLGIGTNQVLLGRAAEARRTYAKVATVMEEAAPRHDAILWSAISYVHEGALDRALAEVQKMVQSSRAHKNALALADDRRVMASILLEAGRPDDALEQSRAEIAELQAADVPPARRDSARRHQHFVAAMAAVARRDLASARAESAVYTREVRARKDPAETRRAHELAGRIHLAAGCPAEAVAELGRADQEDARVLYQLGLALRRQGKHEQARSVLRRAASANDFSLSYAFVRARARSLLAGG